MKAAIVLILATLTFSSIPAQAGDDALYPDLPDEMVEEAISLMRPRVKDLMIAPGKKVGEETAEELLDPLLTRDEVEEVLRRGMISATAEWCGLNWRGTSFFPFMKKWRAAGKTPKQMAYAGALHGLGMSLITDVVKGKTCDSAYAEKVKRSLESDQ